MGYSKRHQERFIVDMDDQERKGWWFLDEEGRQVVEKKVHNQIQKLRAEDSKLGLTIKEALVNGKYRFVGGGGGGGTGHIASVVVFSRPPVALPASPLGSKTSLKHGY
ncbi:hypothetical protein LIER_21184 [Lithospermum erythrorhizon]|uniref:Uncharacterized protein n=1 Tax=Lithospermum erythrorhizon TaxID=34254 RepID=A0AAV3QTH5_LITER